MDIFVNGEPRNVVEHYTIEQLIADLELVGRRLAVEVNLEIVPRSTHKTYQLQAGDRVEIVHAIGGG